MPCGALPFIALRHAEAHDQLREWTLELEARRTGLRYCPARPPGGA